MSTAPPSTRPPATTTRPSAAPCRAPDGDLPGAALLALRDDTLGEPAHLPACKRLLRAQLAWHFGDKPLKSRELFRALAGQTPRPETP